MRNFGVALMLAIAYSASIGGGHADRHSPNALPASFLQKHLRDRLLLTGMPLGKIAVAVMLPVTWLILTCLLRPAHRIAIDDPRGVVEKELRCAGRHVAWRETAASEFLGAATCWILRSLLAKRPACLDDTIIAFTAALLLFAVPISRAASCARLGGGANVPWGVLLLFGGGGWR